MVKVMEVDGQGRVNLSRKAVLAGASDNGSTEPEPMRTGGGFGGGGRRPRRPRPRG